MLSVTECPKYRDTVLPNNTKKDEMINSISTDPGISNTIVRDINSDTADQHVDCDTKSSHADESSIPGQNIFSNPPALSNDLAGHIQHIPASSEDKKQVEALSDANYFHASQHNMYKSPTHTMYKHTSTSEPIDANETQHKSIISKEDVNDVQKMFETKDSMIHNSMLDTPSLLSSSPSILHITDSKNIQQTLTLEDRKAITLANIHLQSIIKKKGPMSLVKLTDHIICQLPVQSVSVILKFTSKEDYVKAQTDKFYIDPVTNIVLSVEEAKTQMNKYLLDVLKVKGAMQLQRLLGHMSQAPNDEREAVMSVFANPEEFIRDQAHMFYIDAASGLVWGVEEHVELAMKYFKTVIKTEGPMEIHKIVSHINKTPGRVIIEGIFGGAEQFLKKMDQIFLVKNNILSLVQEKHKTIPQVEEAASEIKSLELVTIKSQPSQEENTSSPTPEQKSSQTALSNKNKPLAFTPNEFKSISFFKEVITKKGGHLQMKNLLGHISEAPPVVVGFVGSKPQEIKDFIKNLNSVFTVDANENVSLVKNKSHDDRRPDKDQKIKKATKQVSQHLLHILKIKGPLVMCRITCHVNQAPDTAWTILKEEGMKPEEIIRSQSHIFYVSNTGVVSAVQEKNTLQSIKKDAMNMPQKESSISVMEVKKQVSQHPKVFQLISNDIECTTKEKTNSTKNGHVKETMPVHETNHYPNKATAIPHESKIFSMGQKIQNVQANVKHMYPQYGVLTWQGEGEIYMNKMPCSSVSLDMENLKDFFKKGDTVLVNMQKGDDSTHYTWIATEVWRVDNSSTDDSKIKVQRHQGIFFPNPLVAYIKAQQTHELNVTKRNEEDTTSLTDSDDEETADTANINNADDEATADTANITNADYGNVIANTANLKEVAYEEIITDTANFKDAMNGNTMDTVLSTSFQAKYNTSTRETLFSESMPQMSKREQVQPEIGHLTSMAVQTQTTRKLSQSVGCQTEELSHDIRVQTEDVKQVRCVQVQTCSTGHMISSNIYEI